MTDCKALAALIFGDLAKTAREYEEMYPPRNLGGNGAVTRFAPSPTGFLHIGGLFTAMISKRVAKQSGGVFLLRIEDTDKKREVENGVAGITRGLSDFGVTANEGVISQTEETGDYGPYVQSRRGEIYRAFAKELMEKGLAYPCFCSEECLSQTRQTQEANKQKTGYYGQYAVCRDLEYDQVKTLIEQNAPYVVRLKSPGDESKKVAFNDVIKGRIEMPQNDSDIVLLKADGVPTYHFAHAVDDHLMRVTHVIRGDEWISSVPVHLQLFELLGFAPPRYAHIAPIMKEEDGGKRKLSKRKDPEAAIDFYRERGYPRQSVAEYLLTLASSGYEQWRRCNPGVSDGEFPFELKKMSLSGALFDLAKLNDVSKNVICPMTAEDVLAQVSEWAREYDAEFYSLLSVDPEYAKAMLSIDRYTKKPRKDIACWSEVKAYYSYFFDSLFLEPRELPENISKADAAAVLERYLTVYSADDSKDGWFAKIKDLCEPLGFAREVKAYKKNPEDYKGHVGDVSGIIRVAVTARKNTPDLYEIMKLLGEQRVRQRIGLGM